MAYASASDVSGHVRNLLGSDVNFGSSTSPTLNSVNSWLSAGCALIEMKLVSCRYSVPAASGTTAYDYLKHLNAIYAAAYAEFSRTNTTLGPGERTRGTQYLETFERGLDSLCEMDLTGAGLSRSTAGVVYAGGISRSVKQANETNTDRVTPRFSRNLHKFPGTVDPTTTTAS